MSETATSSKKRVRLTHKEKKAAAAEAARKARMQWYVIGAILVIAIVAAIVLISIFTEGSIPIQTAPNGS